MTTRKALIVGATGLIGGYCLQALLDDPNYSEVIIHVGDGGQAVIGNVGGG
jgi:uncharacterized protein YbjT (DUF2867 family)